MAAPEPTVRLECFEVHRGGAKTTIVPGSGARDWMDHTNQHFAYRCTPLTMANCSGWELLNPSAFSATWTGRNGSSDVILMPHEAGAPMGHATTGFGHGILTIHPGYLFRTDPGWMISARGSPNRIKDGIHPLEGVVESSWLPFTFTMNWKFTRPCTVHFEKDEPLCFITLVPSVSIENVQPVIRQLDDVPDLQREYKIWDSERKRFNYALSILDPVAMEEKWQKHYLTGKSPTGRSMADETHRVKRTLKSPIRAESENETMSPAASRGKQR